MPPPTPPTTTMDDDERHQVQYLEVEQFGTNPGNLRMFAFVPADYTAVRARGRVAWLRPERRGL